MALAVGSRGYQDCVLARRWLGLRCGLMRRLPCLPSTLALPMRKFSCISKLKCKMHSQRRDLRPHKATSRAIAHSIAWQVLCMLKKVSVTTCKDAHR